MPWYQISLSLSHQQHFYSVCSSCVTVCESVHSLFLSPPVREQNTISQTYQWEEAEREQETNNDISAEKSSSYKSLLFYPVLSLGTCLSLRLNTAKMAVLAAHMLRGTRKPVETVHSGPRKHTERFGCNSHIGQLNATTSALSQPFAYGIHMLMMSLVFFFFFSCMCVCACMFVCVLFVSLLCIFFVPVLPPLLPFSLYRQTKRDAENLDSYFLFLKKQQKKKRYARPIFTSSRLTIKGEVRGVPQLFNCRAPDFDKKPL